MSESPQTQASGESFSVDNIILGGGVTQADLPLMEHALSQALNRLGRVRGNVEAEVSIKDRDSADPKTTFEVWIHGLPRLVSTSAEPEPRDALHEVGAHMVRQLTEMSERREPKNNRQRRDSIRG